MRVECPNCGGAHPAWDCKRPAKKSTAALLETRNVGRETADHKSSSARNTVASGGVTEAGVVLPVDTHNPSSRKGSGVESLRTPTEGRKGRDSTLEGARAKLRDPSAVLTQTAAQPPVGTNSSHTESEALASFGSQTVVTNTFAGTVGNKDWHTNLARSAHKGENPRHADVGKPLTQTRRPRGRPRIHPDRKAYKAQWERDKRKRLKGVATEITSHALQSVIGTGFSKPSIDLHPDRIKSRAVDPKEG